MPAPSREPGQRSEKVATAVQGAAPPRQGAYGPRPYFHVLTWTLSYIRPTACASGTRGDPVKPTPLFWIWGRKKEFPVERDKKEPSRQGDGTMSLPFRNPQIRSLWPRDPPNTSGSSSNPTWRGSKPQMIKDPKFATALCSLFPEWAGMSIQELEGSSLKRLRDRNWTQYCPLPHLKAVSSQVV